MQTSTDTTRTFSFADDDPISLELSNHSGDVAVLLDAPDGTATLTLTSSRPVDFEPVTATCRRGRVHVEIPALLDPEGGRGFAFTLGRFSIGSGTTPIHVEVHLPHGTALDVSTKQGDIVLNGTAGATRVRSGSGDLAIEETGELRASTGSGDVRVGLIAGGSVTSGSGDIVVDTAAGPHPVEIRTGTGDVTLVESHHDVSIATGSGDIEAGHRRGALTARTGTGDVEITVPHGIPLWLELSSGLGEVRRDVDGVGAPEPGQEHLRVGVRTGTGDIRVHH